MCSEATEFAEDAIEEAIVYSTLGIASEDGSTLGTGVAIEYDAHNLVATAKHVVETADLDSLWFYFRSDAPLIRGAKKDLENHIKEVTVRERFRIPITRILTSDAIDDLAVLVIDSSFISIPNLRFHRVDDCRETPEVGTGVAVFGFAAEILQQVKEVSTGRRGYMTVGNFEWRSIVSIMDDELDEFDLTRHYLIDFSGETESEEFVTKPHSMSGSGVWTYPSFLNSELWSPTNVQLCGIQSSWYPRKHLLKAIRIERLLKLLKEL